jgi:hypothetical protein
MNRALFIFVFVVCICTEATAHNVGNAITWNREISRVVYQRCAMCHREGGSAFSLMKYQEVQPRAVEIKEAVLSRRMPPWGAVKGFGEFREDRGLSQAELELITDWVDSDTPKGNNPNALPKEPKFDKSSIYKPPKNALAISGEVTLKQDMTLSGLLPLKGPSAPSMKIVATLPDGETKPLLWLYEYDDRYQHPFFYREVVDLPAGTVIRGVSNDSRIALIPGKKRKAN